MGGPGTSFPTVENAVSSKRSPSKQLRFPQKAEFKRSSFKRSQASNEKSPVMYVTLHKSPWDDIPIMEWRKQRNKKKFDGKKKKRKKGGAVLFAARKKRTQAVLKNLDEQNPVKDDPVEEKDDLDESMDICIPSYPLFLHMHV